MTADWNTCSSVSDEGDVAGWLRARAIEPRAVARRDLARARPGTLVVPLFDSNGRLAAMHAEPAIDSINATGDLARGTGPNAAAYPGLLMANLIGRAILFTGQSPSWWQWRTVVVVMDLVDYLSWGTAYADAEDVPAVFMVPLGGWTQTHAQRIPDGVRVLVRSSPAVAEPIVDTLQRRCEVIVRR